MVGAPRQWDEIAMNASWLDREGQGEEDWESEGGAPASLWAGIWPSGTPGHEGQTRGNATPPGAHDPLKVTEALTLPQGTSGMAAELARSAPRGPSLPSSG